MKWLRNLLVNYHLLDPDVGGAIVIVLVVLIICWIVSLKVGWP